MIHPVLRIGVQRVDGVGDALLTLPFLAFLRALYPEAICIVLSSETNRFVFESASFPLDSIMTPDPKDFNQCVDQIRDAQLDWVIHLSHRPWVIRAVCMAGVPKRTILLMHRLFHQWHLFYRYRRYRKLGRFCNDVHWASRRCLQKSHITLSFYQSIQHQPIHLGAWMKARGFLSPEIRARYAWKLNPDQTHIVLHPGSSSESFNHREWPLDYYMQLIEQIPDHVALYITGSNHEKKRLNPLFDVFPRLHNLLGAISAWQWMGLIDSASGLVSGSTGAIHMAAALHQRGLALFFSSQEYVQWKPVSDHIDVFYPNLPKRQVKRDRKRKTLMHHLSVQSVYQHVSAWWGEG